MSKKILELYDAIAASVGWYSDEQGFISEIFPGGEKGDPVTHGQHRLVMPVDEQLRIHDWSKRYAFHPLLQSRVGGDSPVMDKLRNRTNAYGNYVLGAVIMFLARLAADKKKHSSLTPEQAAYLKPFSEADQTLVEKLHQILKLDQTHKNHREYVRFTLVKGQTWNGKKRARVATAHFTVYETLSQDNFDRNFCGISLRVKDVKMIRAMYEHIFPNVDDREEWKRGSDDSSIAPSIESLMQIYARVATCINKVIDDMGDALPGGEFLRIPLNWVDDFSNLPALMPEIRKIPLLEGNVARGSIASEADTPKITASLSDSAVTAVYEQATSAAPTQQAAAPVQERRIPKFGVPVEQKPVEQSTKFGTAEPAKAAIPTASAFKPYVPSEIVQPAEEALRRKQEQQAQLAALNGQRQQGQQNKGEGVELPAGSRLIGNQLYVPAPKSATGVIPNGARMHEGILMIPYQPGAAPGALLGGTNTGMGMNMNNQQAMIRGLLDGTIDPANIPGIDKETADALRGNPFLIQNYVQQMVGNAAAAAAPMQQQAAQQVPNYLRKAAILGQANQLAQHGAALGGGGSTGFGRFGVNNNNTGGGFNTGFGGFGRGFG